MLWEVYYLGIGPLLRIGAQFGVIVMLAAGPVLLPAQTAAHPPKQAVEAPAAITRVRVLLSQGPPAIEVTATRAVSPQIQKVDNPQRLVIDLPNTVMSVRSKRIDVKSDQVSAIRLDQYQDKPPVVRIVMDLLKPIEYTSNAAGNVLTVRLNQPAVARQSPPAPSVPAFTKGVEPAMTPVSPGLNGAIVLAGSRIGNGSSVSAGAETAVLKLTRGGEVRLCPGSSVSVTQSKNGRDLLLGMSTGSLETHYSSANDADAILTPDFRILLAGPGDFHYAISADARGNTCVRSLPGNTAPIVVSELMGDGTYQVKPSEQIVFRSGKLSDPDNVIPANCGCPPPPVPALRASTAAQPLVPESKMPANTRLASPADEDKPITVPPVNAGPQSNTAASQVTLAVAPETAPLPATASNDVHVRVDAPFVFRAADAGAAAAAPATQAAQLPVADVQRTPPATPAVTPAPPPQQPPPAKDRRGFFGKMKGFFSSVFH